MSRQPDKTTIQINLQNFQDAHAVEISLADSVELQQYTTRTNIEGKTATLQVQKTLATQYMIDLTFFDKFDRVIERSYISTTLPLDTNLFSPFPVSGHYGISPTSFNKFTNDKTVFTQLAIKSLEETTIGSSHQYYLLTSKNVPSPAGQFSLIFTGNSEYNLRHRAPISMTPEVFLFIPPRVDICETAVGVLSSYYSSPEIANMLSQSFNFSKHRFNFALMESTITEQLKTTIPNRIEDIKRETTKYKQHLSTKKVAMTKVGPVVALRNIGCLSYFRNCNRHYKVFPLSYEDSILICCITVEAYLHLFSVNTSSHPEIDG